jgi:hypothetical protein
MKRKNSDKAVEEGAQSVRASYSVDFDIRIDFEISEGLSITQSN